MDLESNQEADTQVTFRVASFPRSSFRYPSSRMSKRASSANLSDAEPLTQTSPKASPTRPRTASRLHPTPKSPSALRHESSSASSASEVSSKQSVTTPSDTSETSDAVSSASEALENMRLHRKTPDTTSKRDRNGKGSMIAIGGKLYPVTSPSPSPQTPERVVKPKQGNSSERTKTRNDFHTPPYANQATGNHEEYSPSPLRKRSMVVPNSANSDIPSSMPSEKMADDTYTEIEAWLAQNRASSPVPAQKPIPSSASEPTLQPSGLPVAKSRHAQKRVPLPSNPSISRASSSHPQAHRHSSSEDVFLSSPSQAPQRPKSPRLEHHARSSSSSLQHTRSQSDMALSSRGSSSSSQSSISYHRSPSPTPFDDVPRPVSPNPLTGSTNTVTGKTFARPRQPTPPQQPYMPPQPQQRPGFRPYPIASSPAPAAPSWPSSQAPYFMHQTSSMSELSSYAPYQLSQSPAPFSLPPSAPTPAPALSYHPAPQAQPPASPPRRVVCYGESSLMSTSAVPMLMDCLNSACGTSLCRCTRRRAVDATRRGDRHFENRPFWLVVWPVANVGTKRPRPLEPCPNFIICSLEKDTYIDALVVRKYRFLAHPKCHIAFKIYKRLCDLRCNNYRKERKNIPQSRTSSCRDRQSTEEGSVLKRQGKASRVIAHLVL